MWHRYHYCVLGLSLISDAEYDQLERSVRTQWSVSVVSHVVASDDVNDYPGYIREGRRPNFLEREQRDQVIQQRWMNNL